MPDVRALATRWLRRAHLLEPARSLVHRLRPLPAAQKKNRRYDEETAEVIRRVLRPDSCCLDVGAHLGSVLRLMLACAPEGRHEAFEPLPAMAAELRAAFPAVRVHELALAAEGGNATFQHVVTNPGYSGLKRRSYPGPVRIEPITVRTARLDDVIDPTLPVSLIKVDVEGAELGVLLGGATTLARWQPYVIFEHGLGGADHYGTTPEEVARVLEDCGLELTLMRRWLRGQGPLGRAAFVDSVLARRDFYYLATPRVPARRPAVRY